MYKVSGGDGGGNVTVMIVQRADVTSRPVAQLHCLVSTGHFEAQAEGRGVAWVLCVWAYIGRWNIFDGIIAMRKARIDVP